MAIYGYFYLEFVALALGSNATKLFMVLITFKLCIAIAGLMKKSMEKSSGVTAQSTPSKYFGS